MNKILLSYSAINDLYSASHTWINKVMGIKTPENEYMKKGKEVHNIIQDHMIGIKKDERLKELGWTFQKKEHHARLDFNDKYQFHGFLDAISFNSKVMCEIKSTSKKESMWSQGKFDESIQWKYYGYVTKFRKVLFITCPFDLSCFRTYYREITGEDIEKARLWAEGGVAILEKGDFTGGLDESGHCLGCNYKENCHFL